MALTHDRDNCDPKTIPGDGPAAKTFGSVADTLLGARKEHGQDLRAVAQVLRIRYEYLEAIEAGAFERLPGTTYAHGFLRTYAEFLGLDGDEIVERFKQEMHGSESKPELVFGYRSVNVTSNVIVSTRLKLVEADPEQLLRTVKEIWIYKKNSQPLSSKNAGCVFKNERGISAGALIDRAGLKGLQIGGAKVSEKHANFVLTEKNCTSSDVKRLIDAIRERVKERSDIDLELELEIW